MATMQSYICDVSDSIYNGASCSYPLPPYFGRISPRIKFKNTSDIWFSRYML